MKNRVSALKLALAGVGPSGPLALYDNTIMQLRRFIRSAIIVLAARMLAQNHVQCQTWQTVLDLQSSGSIGFCLAADAFGNVLSGGDGGSSSSNAGLVLRTDTSESTWEVSDQFNPSPGLDWVDVNGLAMDSSGDWYSVGTIWSSVSYSWYVHKSSNAGSSWSTVDLFQYAAGKGAGAEAVAIDLAGNIFVVGVGTDASGNSHWLVRKSADGGQTWTTSDDLSGASAKSIAFVPGVGLFAAGVGPGTKTSSGPWTVRRSLDGGATWATADSYLPPKGYTSNAWGVSSDANGCVYVVGRQTVLAGKIATLAWTVRQSTDSGSTWSTVDMFSYSTGKNSWARGIGPNSAGNMVVVGSALDVQGLDHWLVRRPSTHGWQTVDDFQLASGSNAQAYGTATDAAGNLMVAGYANDLSGVSHWLVRRF